MASMFSRPTFAVSDQQAECECECECEADVVVSGVLSQLSNPEISLHQSPTDQDFLGVGKLIRSKSTCRGQTLPIDALHQHPTP